MHKKLLKYYLVFIVLGSVIFGAFYVYLHKNIRSNADEPQVDMAYAAAEKISGGEVPASVVTRDIVVDMRESAAPFIMVFDENGEILESGAKLGKNLPVPPEGVLYYARTHADNRITWEPEAGVRIAIVVKYYSGKNSGYILAGRSLSAVENQIMRLDQIMISSWFVMLIFGYIIIRLLIKR